MKKKFKAIIPLVLTTTMVFSQFTLTWGASAFSTIDNYVMDSQKIVDGLTYQHIVKLTTLGNVDIHTLYYDSDCPNVDLEIFRSSDLGKRDTLTNMATNENVLAGVNASFFDTSKSYSDILGFEKDNGEIFYARNKYNETPQASSLMINEDLGLFDVDYIVPTLNLSTGAGRSISITGYNTVSSFFNPAVIKGNKLDDTTYIDNNYSVWKVITDDQGYIKQVVEPKTVVDVADDEYLITLPQASYDALGGSLDVGDQFTFSITANVDLDQYDTIVSGGGTLVRDGQVDMSGIEVSANSRQPRTAIGVTKDGDIIEMVVDGRGDSLGATLEEMANYMIQMGAYQAISLDGGGSTEMVKKDETGTVRIENVPSDGSERKVTNGVGFIASLKTGVPTQVQYLNDDRTFVGNPLKIKVVGKDEYYNNVNLDTTKLTYSVEGVDGEFNGSTFIPQTSGTATITTYYDGTELSSQEVIVEPQPTEVFFEDNPQVVEPNGSLSLSVYTLDQDGYKYKLSDDITWSVDNTLATITNGKLTAGTETGKVTVMATTPYGSVSEQVMIGSEKTSIPITGFENGETVQTVLEPEGTEGKAVVSQDWTPEGANAVKIRYGFSPDIEEKQVVSANLSGITIDEADRIKFDMTTKAMDNAVTMTLVDSSGTSYRIVMADSFDTDGKRTLVADLPSDISYPATLKSINVEYQPSAEKTEEEIGAIYFDNIMTEVDTKIENNQPSYPKTDELATDNVSNERLSVIGKVSYPTGSENLAINSLEPKAENSAKTYVSKTSSGLSNSVGNTTIGNDVYSKNQETAFDANVYTLASSGNTILKSDSKQWKNMLNDIKATTKKNIVIIANKSPLSTGYDETESYVMTSRLTELAEDYGKNIYFINGSGHEEVPTVTYKDNVHYIGLPETTLSSKADAPWSVDFYLEDGDLKYNFSK